jgi:hypothetical protein
MSASSYDVTVQVLNTIDNINIQYDNSVTQITLTEVIPSISVIEVGTTFAPLLSVNGYVGDPFFTASTTLGTVTPTNGVYSYNFSHNLHYANPLVMLYNSSNEVVNAQISASGSETVIVKALQDLNGYKVVVQA